MIVKRTRIYDKLVKSKREFSRLLEKVFDMQGARFLHVLGCTPDMSSTCQKLKALDIGLLTTLSTINFIYNRLR